MPHCGMLRMLIRGRIEPSKCPVRVYGVHLMSGLDAILCYIG